MPHGPNTVQAVGTGSPLLRSEATTLLDITPIGARTDKA
ncbi:MAG: hypothetical protein JWO26_147 [Rhodospirillales bacterium]|nr:hypothetical protein [Rhodospirillales bacterium]